MTVIVARQTVRLLRILGTESLFSLVSEPGVLTVSPYAPWTHLCSAPPVVENEVITTNR